ncbi:MAG: nitroreductase family protein [Bacteroidales bacterium]|jgi:nitroreductase
MIDGKSMLEVISGRQSDRKYSSKPVENEKLERIIEAGRISPSACNAQPWKFIVVNDPGLIRDLAKAAAASLIGMNSFVSQAPILIVVVREKPNVSSRIGSTIKNKDYSRIDIGIASENICLQAKAEGLGSCMLGWFDEPQVKSLLSIPRSKRVELIITIGYSLSDQRQKKRKSIEEVTSCNKY